MYKRCNKCGKDKIYNNFDYNRKLKDYRQSICKKCLRSKIKQKTIIAIQEKITICNICKQEKSINEFHKDGVNYKFICKLCRAKKSKQYYSENSDRIKQKIILYRIHNPDKIKQQKLNDYKKHKKRCLIANKKRRDLKKTNNDPYLSSDFDTKIKAKFEYKCYKCKNTTNLTIDHHYPLHKNHILTENNAVLLCRKCNAKKWTQDPENFYTKEELEILHNMGIKNIHKK